MSDTNPIPDIPQTPVVPLYPALGSASFNAEAWAYGTAMPGVSMRLGEIAAAARQCALAAQEKAQATANSVTDAAALVAAATAQADASMGYRNQAGASANTATTKASEAAASASTASTKAGQAATHEANAAESVLAAKREADRAKEAVDSVASGPVTSVNTKTGVVNLTATDIAPAATVAEMQAGTEQEPRSLSPYLIAQAIAAKPVLEIVTPTNISPAHLATGITDGAVTLVGSPYYEMYSAPQTAMQVQLSKSASFTAPSYSSGDVPAGTSFKVPAGNLAVNTIYYWRIRYKSERGTYSEWSTPTRFTTAAQFNVTIPAPAATPPAFGDPLEGGFYAGMIWNELVQSSTNNTLATGVTKSFTVPSMIYTPLVYVGQQLEVRSRANPANKFVGAVVAVTDTVITVNVTSIGGSGTFSDWSIMSRYRVIVAPKSSGENRATSLLGPSFATTLFPEACQTLTEGLRSTEAMRKDGDAAKYPAAHWARGLAIGGWTDWYIPARDELELCARNLKPNTTSNYTTADRPTAATANYANNGSYGDTAATHGLNNHSAPAGAAYTSGVPAQTAATAFATGGAEAFSNDQVLTSSEYSAANAWQQYYVASPGRQNAVGKSSTLVARAVRRSII